VTRTSQVRGRVHAHSRRTHSLHRTALSLTAHSLTVPSPRPHAASSRPPLPFHRQAVFVKTASATLTLTLALTLTLTLASP
jgi:hypothetical protein